MVEESETGAGRASTFQFSSEGVKNLWNELVGQISDGAWENTDGTGWHYWASLKQSVGGGKSRIEGFVPYGVKRGFNFARLYDIVGDQWLAAVQRAEPEATDGTVIRYLKEIKEAMAAAKDNPYSEDKEGPESGSTVPGPTAVTGLPDEDEQRKEHVHMLAVAFKTAGLPLNIGHVQAECFLFAPMGSRAGQYHYFAVIDDAQNHKRIAVSCYGKLGKMPKGVLLGSGYSLSDVIKEFVSPKAKAKIHSGYDMTSLAGIRKELNPITGMIKRPSPV